MDPLEIPEINLRPGNIDIDLKDCKMYGSTAVKELRSFHWDREAGTVEGTIFVPVFHLIADYKVSGRILVLPISGSGPFDLKMGKYPLVAESSFLCQQVLT